MEFQLGEEGRKGRRERGGWFVGPAGTEDLGGLVLEGAGGEV